MRYIDIKNEIIPSSCRPYIVMHFQHDAFADSVKNRRIPLHAKNVHRTNVPQPPPIDDSFELYVAAHGPNRKNIRLVIRTFPKTRPTGPGDINIKPTAYTRSIEYGRDDHRSFRELRSRNRGHGEAGFETPLISMFRRDARKELMLIENSIPVDIEYL
jgi:hypothetical protein